MNSIIEVKNLSKRYGINQRREPYGSLRDTLSNIALNPLKFIKKKVSESFNKEEFWALKNVNFNVQKGEVVGIIGPNGAGKSTLLKILSKITPPTEGEIILRGKVASLLEVGTGFHSELTGRENVYFSGAILGMTKEEIDRKFDDIVKFSGVGQFIDTPIKRHSSGMQVRLAFSIAAHMEPDIFLVDEVLAVGDSEFQKKSLAKMEEIARGGRTVLFVSHSMASISRLCKRGILLRQGQVAATGEIEQVIKEYLKAVQQSSELNCDNDNRYGNEVVQLVGVKAVDEGGHTFHSFDIRKPIGIEIAYRVKKPGIWIVNSIQLTNGMGVIIFHSPEFTAVSPKSVPDREGLYKSICWIPGNFLAEGMFSVRVDIEVGSESVSRAIECANAISFNVHDHLEGGSAKDKSTRAFPGVVRPILEWQREGLNPERDS